NILDIIENSIRAEASLICIELDERIKDDILSVKITDDGRGMNEEFVKQITNPFVTTRTTRRVGLGLPFLKQLAEMCEGSLDLVSVPGEGTELTLNLRLSHIDTPPVGDIASVIHSVIHMNPEKDFVFTYKVNDNEFKLDIRDWKAVLEDVPINDFEVQKALKKEIESGLKQIGR
ncbi:MAG: ATP-binding protein, partial [Candidatus Muiribacteriaceae bacterium]